jgi:hypothetical protein
MLGKMARSDPDQALGLPEVLVAVSTSRLSCKRVWKTQTLMPVWDSSGESRFRQFPSGLPPESDPGVCACLLTPSGYRHGLKREVGAADPLVALPLAQPRSFYISRMLLSGRRLERSIHPNPENCTPLWRYSLSSARPAKRLSEQRG